MKKLILSALVVLQSGACATTTFFDIPVESDPTTLGKVTLAGGLQLLRFNGVRPSDDSPWNFQKGFLKTANTRSFFVAPGSHTISFQYFAQFTTPMGNGQSMVTTVRSLPKTQKFDIGPGERVFACYHEWSEGFMGRKKFFKLGLRKYPPGNKTPKGKVPRGCDGSPAPAGTAL